MHRTERHAPAVMNTESINRLVCNHVLNAGPNFQPKYCSECGQKIDFSEVKWEEEKILEHAGRRLANE